MIRIVALLLLMIAASPGAFWLFYGTLDPCAAVPARAAQLFAADNRGNPATAVAIQLYAPAAFERLIVELSPRQCLDLLWKLETSDRGVS